MFSMKKRAYLKKARMAKLLTTLTTSHVRRLQKKAPTVISEKINPNIAIVGLSVGGPAKVIPRQARVPMAVIKKAAFITRSSKSSMVRRVRHSNFFLSIGQWSIKATRSEER